jgi:hypothetical protein
MRTLLVVTTGNLEHVTAELITESIAGNLIKEILISQSFSIVVCVYVYVDRFDCRTVGEG